ncbi:hypothetical protein PG996_010893 [Apiospora saccharicola]|uniref:Uncharacterized protein n=1 Tax=Apiospora saccharicola TaxID=335842 RepID=A0ABR1UT04_9PEZI
MTSRCPEPNQFRPLAGEAAVEVGDVSSLVDPRLVRLAHGAVGVGRLVAARGEVLVLVLDAGLEETVSNDREPRKRGRALVELEVEVLAGGDLLVAAADDVAGGVLDGDVGLVVVAFDNLHVHAAPAPVELALLDRGGGGAREQVLVLVATLTVLVDDEVHGLGRDDGFVGGTKSEGSGSFTHRGGRGGEAGGGKAQESGDDGDLHLDGD